MTSEPASSAPFDALYNTYASKLRGWLLRRGVPANCLHDAEQDFWLVVSKDARRFAGLEDTRNELLNLARNIARRAQRQEEQDRLLHDRRAEPDHLFDHSADSPLEILQARQLLETIDELEEPLREVFILYRVLGFNTREVAEMLGIDETTVSARALTASALIRKKVARKEAKDRHKLGVLFVTTDIEIRPEFRAAFCAIWEAEGRLPTIGDPKRRPPPPPWWIVSVVPAMQTAAETLVSRAKQVVLTILLLFVPASLIALHYFWDPAKPNTARTGLQVPQTPDIGEINDVVDAYPAAPAPAAPSASASVAPIPTTRKASPALDDDALRALRLDGSAVTRSRQE